MTIKGVILIGGPYKNNQLAPFTSSQPAPLFPIAGVELIYHQIFALSKIKNLNHIYLIGLYPQNQIHSFLTKCRVEYKSISFDYLYEDEEKGTAGSLCQFKNNLFQGETQNIILINGDIAHNINLQKLLDFHSSLNNPACTIAGKHKDEDNDPKKYGCIIKNDKTHELLHYVEKPQNYVSEFLINTGIYILSPLFSKLLETSKQERNKSLLQTYPEHLLQKLHSPLKNHEWLSLESDVISNNVQTGQIFVYEIPEQQDLFWTQVKNPIDVLKAQKLLLGTLNINSQILNKSYHKNWEHRSDSVLIDTQSTIDPTANIGPNVVICTGVVIGEGVRIKNSIILEGTVIKDHSFISDSIVGWHSELGYWSRVEGTKDESVTILGCGVQVGNEVSIRNCVVLKQQYLSRNYSDQYIIC